MNKMNEYEVEWDSSHSKIIKAHSSEEAIEEAIEEADSVVSFVAMIDGPFARLVHSGD
jgi:hypothetical protein